MIITAIIITANYNKFGYFLILIFY